MKTQFTLRLDETDKAHIDQLKRRFRERTSSAAVMRAVRLFLQVEDELTEKMQAVGRVEARYNELEQLVNDLIAAHAGEIRARQRVIDWLGRSLDEEDRHVSQQ